jgi:hypothetical protein
VPNKHDGYYVDVGSGDGVFVSNTKIAGRHGLERSLYRSVSQEYVQPDLPTVPSACFQREWEKGVLSRRWHAGWHHADVGRKLRAPCGVQQAPLVDFSTATLDEILEKAHAPKHIDFMSIDVQGAEYEVLWGLSLDSRGCKPSPSNITTRNRSVS